MRRYTRPALHAAISLATILVLVYSAVTLTTTDAHAGSINLLTNGNFASCSGTPANWSTTGYGCDGFASAIAYVPGGATNWISAGVPGLASQTFTDTSGVTYTVSGWVQIGSAHASVTVDSATIITVGNASNGSASWTEYTGTFVGTGTDTISLVTPNSIPGYTAFTAFSAVATVPEPASLALVGFGVAVLGMTRRRHA